jgi:ABC-type polysaccharide/polyol phosphate export permease
MLSAYLNLLREITLADFKLRYYGSILGILWAFAKPFLMFAVLYTVFSFITRFNTDNYAWFLLLGVIFWSFFSDATAKSTLNMENKADFIRRVSFPREIVIYSACLNSLITFCINILAYVSLVVLFGGPLPLTSLLLIVPALQLFFLAAGVSFILAVIYVKARDIAHVWEVLLQALFWATPIVYPLAIVPQKYRFLVLLNPIASIVGEARALAINGALPALGSVLPMFALSLAVLLAGFLVFARQSKYFAEEL